MEKQNCRLRVRLNHTTMSILLLVLILFIAFVPKIAYEMTIYRNQNQERIEELLQKGNEHFAKAQYQEALQNYSQALELSRQIGDESKEALSLNSIGVVYYRVGRYDDALSHYRQSLEIFLRTEDLVGQARSLLYTGLLYNKDIGSVLVHFKRILRIYTINY